MEPLLLIAIFFPIVFSPIFWLIERRAPRFLGLVATIAPLVSTVALYQVGKMVSWNVPTTLTFPWVPLLSIEFSLLIDGLSLFFGFLVTIMGTLVCLYSQSFMHHRKRHLGRFYVLLLFFMSSMLGTVFSNDFILLFIFWELTGIASFLLIGFYYEDREGIDGANIALLVTGFTGLALLIGCLLLGMEAGTYNWSGIVDSLPTINRDSPWFHAAFVLFLVGIFGKSAQIPFHFWLPNAMVAPTPVSAYLHAATMVKLGVFLTARIYPLFVESALWFPLMATFCFGTMLLGAFLSLLSNELKQILAYATVSQLGFFIGFYGMGGTQGVEYDFVHILNHAFYKGSLFMLVGIVDQATGIHDIRKLGGLWRKMPLTAVIFFIAAAAMAGIPGSTGFLSKELFLGDVIPFGQTYQSGWVILCVVGFAFLFTVAFSIRLFYHIFIRPHPHHAERFFQPPGLAIHVSPLVLSGAALYFGFAPSLLIRITQMFHVPGLHLDTVQEASWHSGYLALGIGTTILVLGTLFFLLAERTDWRWTGIPALLRFDETFRWCVRKIQKIAITSVRWFYSSRPDDGIIVLLGTVVLLVGGWLLRKVPLSFFEEFPIRGLGSTGGILRWCIVAFTIASASCVIVLPRLIGQLIAVSTTGFFITLYFVLYKAPDLAMTQLLIEVTTLFFVLFLLQVVLQKGKPLQTHRRRRAVQLFIAMGVGTLAAVVANMTMQNPIENRLGTFFIEHTWTLAKGKNAVNTILVDFRGLDTLGEISVLLLASLGAMGLWVRYQQKKQKASTET